MGRVLFYAGLIMSSVQALPAAGKVLSLEDAMDAAASKGLSSAKSRLESQAAQFQENQAFRELGPKMSIEGQLMRLSQNKLLGRTMGGQRYPDSIQKGAVVIDQPLTGFVSSLLTLQSQILLTRVAKEKENHTLKDVRFSAAEAYINLQKAQYLKKVARLSLELAEKQKADTDALVQVGKLSSADALRMEWSLTEAKAAISEAKTTEELAKLALIELIGWNEPTGFEVSPLEISFIESRKFEAPTLQTVESEAKKSREDLKISEFNYNLSTLAEKASLLDFTPELSLQVKYERDFAAVNMPVLNSFGFPTGAFYRKEDIQDTLTFGIKLKWTIWDWGLRNQKRNEVLAGVQKSKIEWESVQSRVRVESAQALLQLRQARENLNSAEASKRFAEGFYRLTKLKFEKGTASATEMILAERDQTRAYASLANARGDLNLAWFKLQKVMGKLPTTKI